jgi:hypothetical protein
LLLRVGFVAEREEINQKRTVRYLLLSRHRCSTLKHWNKNWRRVEIAMKICLWNSHVFDKRWHKSYEDLGFVCWIFLRMRNVLQTTSS